MPSRAAIGLIPLIGLLACGDSDRVPTVEDRPVVSIVEASPGLSDRARVSGDSALALALNELPGGEIIEAELEEEDGLLVYAIDIRAAGAEGEYEVLIDATTGDVVAVELEDDDDEDDEDEHDDDDDHDDDHYDDERESGHRR